MEIKSFFLQCLLIGASFICMHEIVFAQNQSTNNLMRQNVVIDETKPSVSICLDTTNDAERDSEDFWFRLHNNTVWAMTFRAENNGVPQKRLKLSDGRIVEALENKAISTPRYQLELNKQKEWSVIELINSSEKNATNSQNSSSLAPRIEWSDIYTINWLPSNTYTLFKIPKKYFSTNLVMSVNYNYQWEMIRGIATESYSPNHKVQTFVGLDKTANRLCQ